MPQRLRIFVSSPADVPDERLRTALIVDKLGQDYGRFFAIETYRWEHEAMLASKHFQDAIEPPSAFDIVVLILWSRLGTPLPEKTEDREYRGIDGRSPVTGTEWEYEDALRAAREKKAPDLLAFRNVSLAPIDPRDPEAQATSMAQLAALNAFWKRNFSDRGEFLAAYDEYRTLDEFAQRLEQSLRRLIERRIKALSGGDPRTEPIWRGDPFRGLASYEFEQAPIFFGRDVAITKATEQLAANARAERAFLLVSGASGAGKSSLVKAGVVPRLMKPQRISGLAFLRRVVMRPGSDGDDVILGLAKALTRADGDNVGLPELIGPGQDASQLASHLRGAVLQPGYLFANALGRLTEAARGSGRLLSFEDAKLILIVDQLEELFTRSSIGAEERRLFIQLLAALARSGTVWIIATLRADFWHRAAEIPELITLAEGQGRIDLATASPAELAEMIRKPAQAAGLSFEVHPETGLGLDAVLAQDAAAAPGALPLLSFTLDELQKDAKARGSVVLTHAGYATLGGLQGAIANRADEVVSALPPAAQAALPRVLRSLTTVTGTADQAPVARSAPLSSFAENSPARILVDALTAARLLVAAGEAGAAPTVRLAHEALIGRWQRARDQLTADRRDLETRALVERQFGRWSQARGRAGKLLLLRNPDLANAVDLANRWGGELDAPTRDYINRSARRARLAQTLTAAAAVLFALVAVAAVSAGWQWQQARLQAVHAQTEAEDQRDRATAQEARANEARDRATAQEALANQARDRAKLEEVQANEARDRAIATQSRLLAERASRLTDQGDTLTAVLLSLEAFRSPADAGPERYAVEAEKSLADAIYRNSLEFTVPYDGNGYAEADYSYDGSRFITVDKKGLVAIWTPKPDGSLSLLAKRPDFGPIKAMVVNPAYPIVLFQGDDKHFFAWNYKSDEKISQISGTCGDEFSFDPNGERLLIFCASDDNTGGNLTLINLATGQSIAKIGPVAKYAMAGNGKRLAVLRKTSTIEVWNAVGGTLMKSWSAPETGDVAMNHDGEIVIATFGYYRIRLWKAATGAVIKNELSIQGRSTDVYTSANTGLFATSGDDGTWIWNEETAAPVQHFPDSVVLGFLPNGMFAAVDNDNQVTLWRYIVESRLGHLEAKRHAVLFVKPEYGRVQRITGDKHLMTLTDNGDVNIWRADSPMLLRANDDAGECLRAPVLSGDGKTIAALGSFTRIGGYIPALCEAVVSADAVILWNAESLAETKRLKLADYGDLNEIAMSADGRRILIGGKAVEKDAKNKDTKNTDSNGSDDAPESYAVIDAATGKRLFPAGAALQTGAATLSRDGRIVYAADGKKVVKWQVDGGSRLGECGIGDDNVLGVYATPNLDRLAVSDEKGAVWSLNPEKCEAKATTLFSEGAGDTIDLISRGHLIAAQSSPDAPTIEIWNDTQQKLIAKLGDPENISDKPFDVFAAQDRIVLAQPLDRDGLADELRVTDTTQKKALLDFPIDNNGCCEPRGVRFFPDGTRILTVWSERNWSRLRVWRAFPTIAPLLQFAKTTVPECLSPSSRKTLGLDTDPPRWCIEMAKAPYDTPDWKAWLGYKDRKLNPPLPDSEEWRPWLAGHGSEH